MHITTPKDNTAIEVTVRIEVQLKYLITLRCVN